MYRCFDSIFKTMSNMPYSINYKNPNFVDYYMCSFLCTIIRDCVIFVLMFCFIVNIFERKGLKTLEYHNMSHISMWGWGALCHCWLTSQVSILSQGCDTLCIIYSQYYSKRLLVVDNLLFVYFWYSKILEYKIFSTLIIYYIIFFDNPNCM